ncbi:hypothetical protein A628_01505 [Salmonella enterica subsp. enterica serovar Cubana str. 76814]|uniref:Uncharacterized protein n=1 Tax=Salmonella enterica subsp. enterica serovar Cubana str. 76814 TaxID=1192560 RepID=V7IRJ7_SALET|nr:hypothetical protein A628_01505 [Salmonella enterica subsp. enterica serovar Cubana str. 76814]
MLIETSTPADEHFSLRFCWLLKRLAHAGEKTVSKRVINGKSHLAITRLAVE